MEYNNITETIVEAKEELVNQVIIDIIFPVRKYFIDILYGISATDTSYILSKSINGDVDKIQLKTDVKDSFFSSLANDGFTINGDKDICISCGEENSMVIHLGYLPCESNNVNTFYALKSISFINTVGEPSCIMDVKFYFSSWNVEILGKPIINYIPRNREKVFQKVMNTCSGVLDNIVNSQDEK